MIADRTGSLMKKSDGEHTRAELITKGIHDIINEQSKEGITTFSLVEFNTQTKRVAWFADASNTDLQEWVCHPYGNTALLDAVGQVIYETGQHLADLPEDQRPERVYIVIGTDGEENSSQEYNLTQINEMIAHQRDVYNWEFVFIGAGLEAFKEASNMGIAAGSALLATGATMDSAYAATNTALTRSRLTKSSVSYSNEERASAVAPSGISTDGSVTAPVSSVS